jgi:hypothetical protein
VGHDKISGMATWAAFHEQAPSFAAAVELRFDAYRHKVLATLRQDGSPRISGIETTVREGELWLGGMPDSLKCLDLIRDPRFALHTATVDPPDGGDPAAWPGDAKIAGTAIEVTDPETCAAFADATPEKPPGPFHLFRVSVTEAVLVRVGKGADHLVIESWHEGRGLSRVERR